MGDSDSKKEKEEKVIVKVKNATDLQRLKLEKLMKNPDKPIIIPDRPKDKALSAAPDFVRNVMGSSAGAGSGEFHVYRHLRRKEYARQKFISEKSEKEKLDEEYHSKIEQNKKLAAEKTAKKRAKRLKKKKLAKLKGKKTKVDNKNNISESDSSEDEVEDLVVKTQTEHKNPGKSDKESPQPEDHNLAEKITEVSEQSNNAHKSTSNSPDNYSSGDSDEADNKTRLTCPSNFL